MPRGWPGFQDKQHPQRKGERVRWYRSCPEVIVWRRLGQAGKDDEIPRMARFHHALFADAADVGAEAALALEPGGFRRSEARAARCSRRARGKMERDERPGVGGNRGARAENDLRKPGPAF